MPVSKNMFSGLRFLKIALPLLFTLVNLTAISQNVNDKTEIAKLMAAVDTFRNNVPAEKIYLHLDKPYYITGDTLWFKIYLFEANFYTASLKSGICYLEIANDQNKLVRRMMLPVVGGLSWGNIALDEKQFTEGGYILRVYTNLMRNWSEEYIYQRQINIYSPSSLPAFDNSVLKGKENTHTGDKSTETKRGQKIYQPGVTTNIDLQFMPEGGDLVNEISTTIGFKAIGEDGKGIHVEGKIYNNKQQEVASFKSLHKGMGTFELTPHNNESYTAKISLPENVTKKYPLPLAHSKGIVMNIINHSSTDSLKVILKATPEIEKQNNSYYLIGQSRGVICFAKMVHFKDTTYFCQLSKTIFPGGITHIVLLNTSMSPVNERIVYIDHHDNLKINIASDKTTYTTRDSVAVNLTVTDKDGKPVQGSFSLSVTDNTQVASDALYPSNITTHLWLTSELKGTVEDPAYYFQTSGDSIPVQQIDTMSMALDNLLLTQGWVAYPWEQVFSQKAPEYQAEPEFMIKGKASNSFKGIPNTRVLLFTKHPFLMIDTLTDKEGRFTFKNLHLRDTASYLIQSLNRRGRSFLNTVSVDEFKPPVFADRHIVFTPLSKMNDSAVINTIKYNIDTRKEEQRRFTGIHLLDEVVVTGNKIVKGSKSLNGSGNADQVLNTADLQKLGKMTLLELLKKQVKGFKIKELDKYYINDYPIKLVMDGLYVDTYDGLFADSNNYNPLKENFENFTAEEIIGIEVMTSPQYNSIYNKKYLSTDELRIIGGTSGKDYAWLEITTRAGKGAYMKRTPGVMLYKPMPFSLPNQFYRPRYLVKDTQNTLPDQRSTIHWDPSVVTNSDGKAVITFYTADKPSRYSIIVEGSDMLGNVGSEMKKGFIRIIPEK